MGARLYNLAPAVVQPRAGRRVGGGIYQGEGTYMRATLYNLAVFRDWPRVRIKRPPCAR